MKTSEHGQLLLRIVMKLVKKELEGQGLRTLAAVVDRDREIQLLVPDTIEQNLKLERIDQYWIEQLRSKIVTSNYEAACYCADTQVSTEENQLVTKAVIVYFEQAGHAEYRFYPYEKQQDSTVTMSDPTIEETPTRLFAIAPAIKTKKRWWSRED